MPEPNLCRHCFPYWRRGDGLFRLRQKPEAPNPVPALPLGTVLSGSTAWVDAAPQ